MTAPLLLITIHYLYARIFNNIWCANWLNAFYKSTISLSSKAHLLLPETPIGQIKFPFQWTLLPD